MFVSGFFYRCYFIHLNGCFDFLIFFHFIGLLCVFTLLYIAWQFFLKLLEYWTHSGILVYWQHYYILSYFLWCVSVVLYTPVWTMLRCRRRISLCLLLWKRLVSTVDSDRWDKTFVTCHQCGDGMKKTKRILKRNNKKCCTHRYIQF